MRNKIIARIKGGLGNQLFCYAAARRLALVNQFELIVDDVTGFIRDHRYQRKYALDHFTIPCRKATPSERLEPLERTRRALAKWRARRQPFAERAYIEQRCNGFEERLLTLAPRGTVYLDGLWQDERYYADVADIIRADLAFKLSPTTENLRIARKIDNCQSVALHVRWFDPPMGKIQTHNLCSDYYNQAIKEIEYNVPSAYYFLFSDNVAAATQKLMIPKNKLTIVEHNIGDDAAICDLWLMRRCKHFVLANSTFSWWGAWLSESINGVKLIPPGIPYLRNAMIWKESMSWLYMDQ